MPLPGIILGDCGLKIGMDGVDNGFILFNQVRIPKDNLLNRFSNITDAGEFQTLIESPDHRFGMQLGALGTGRILVILASSAFLEVCLRIAIRFACMRQQFGKPNEPEDSLIEYPMHQYRLFPLIAKSSMCRFAGSRILQMWGKNQKHLFTPGNRKLAELHSLISCLKGVMSWESVSGL